MPPESEEDVKDPSDPSPEEPENDVKPEDASTPPTAPTEEPEGGVTPPSGEVDERGVPIKNVREEVKRKVLEELQPFIQQQIQEGISRGLQSQPPVQAQPAAPAQPSSWQGFFAPYSDEQLEVWVEENPTYKPIVRSEISRRIETRAEERAFNKLKTETGQQQFQREQAEALTYIQQRYPDAFTDFGGQKVWNQSHPLVQKAMAVYHSRPTFKNDGWGLAGAFDMAYGTLAYDDKTLVTKEKIKVNAQKKLAEKKESQALGSGGGAHPTPQIGMNEAKYQKLLAAARRGDPEAKKALFKMKGLIPAETP